MAEAEMIREFNSTLKSFVTFLNVNSNDEDIQYYYNMLDSILKLDATKAIEQYVLHILPYNKEIQNKNTDFFVNLNLDNQLNNDKKHILKALKLKNMFKILDKEKQDIIFDYLILLSEYSSLYFTSRYN